MKKQRFNPSPSLLLLTLLIGLAFPNLYGQEMKIGQGAHVVVRGNAQIVLNDMSWKQEGTFDPGQGLVVMRGNSTTNLEGNDTLNFYRLVIDKSSNDVILLDTASIGESVGFTQGNLVGGEIFLESGAYLESESETNRAIGNTISKLVSYPAGVVANADSGNLGLVITREETSANQVLIKRFNFSVPQDTTWDGNTVARYYQVDPQSGFPTGTVRAYYYDAELNGLLEANLQLIHKLEGAWTSVDSWTYDPSNNFGEKGGEEVEGFYAIGDFNSSSLGFAISGDARSESGDLIPGVDFSFVDLGATTFVSEASDSTSAFTFYHSPAINNFLGAELKASKTNDIDRINGVDVADVLLIIQDILGGSELGSGIKELAGDVNLDQNHSITDILLIQFFIIGTNNGFLDFPGDTALNAIWDFIPTSEVPSLSTTEPSTYNEARVYANGYNTSDSDQDFIGIKLGDVNNTWNPAVQRQQNYTPVYMNMEDLNVMPGDEFYLPIRTRDFDQIAGYQFTMNWDPSVLQLVETENAALDGVFGTQFAENGQLTVLWNHPQAIAQNLTDGTELFRLKFKAVGAWEQKSSVMIDGSITPSIAYTGNIDPRSIEAGTAEVTLEASTSVGIASDNLNFKVAPNPFETETSLNFNLPEAGPVQIEIFNTLGQLVKVFDDTYKAGNHKLIWDGKDRSGQNLPYGFYHVHFTFQNSQKALTITKE